MPSFFRKILGTQRLNPTSVPPYLLTHPLTEDRIASVETQLAAVGRGKRSGKPAVDRDLEEARAAILAGGESPEHIVSQYQRRVEATPNDGFAHYLLGVVYATVGRLDAALTAFERARELGGAGERLGYRLAYVHLRQRRTAAARVELDRYVAAHPEDPFGQELYGRTLLETNETTRAIDALEAGLALDPNLPESHQLLGRAYGQKGRRGDAHYHLARALELRGKHAEAFTQYMNAREALGPKDPRRPEIETVLTDLAEVSPDAKRRRAGH
jgi:predicted Zn-dependent protease